jgi:hypothetical protein
VRVRSPRSYRHATRRGLATLVLVGEALAGCGRTELPTSSPGAAGAGSAELTVQSNVRTAGSAIGASYERSVTFTAVGQTGCLTLSTSMSAGPCSVNPCLGSSAVTSASTTDGGTEALPNAGAVTIDGAQMQPLTLEPGVDGAYPSDTVKGQLAWTAGGAQVSFQWAEVPGDRSSAGGSATLETPPYIALTPGSAFAVPPTTLPRGQDLTVEWISDTTPAPADKVAVDLESGSVQLVCIFAASAGMGVIPPSALALVPAGAGSYNVHSKEGATTKNVEGSQWSFGFNVDAQARTSSGLAKGAVTFE